MWKVWDFLLHFSYYVVVYFNFNAEIYYFLHVTSWVCVTLWQLSCVLQADQICYAVLCVFSYVAAGHKKQRRPGPSAHAHVSHTPTSGSVSPRGPRYSSHQWWSPPMSSLSLHILCFETPICDLIYTTYILVKMLYNGKFNYYQ